MLLVVAFQEVSNEGVGEAKNFWRDIVTLQNLAADAVDYLAVAVDDVIILHHVLAGVKAKAFHALLCGLQNLGEGAVL